ncbi:PREDICTED: ankyrin repeat domain-containing protein 16-like [Amphimedon queenslandica]|nr:PREDICTED: ankyrin repeat domain-containing protein 16-like [Amphimedon queenslandica]|eukprot:XP_019852557.1 PREDICTED: ankyrin repeat domain-containing protein 16-like [Amphimedon queenslandica]
MVSLLLETSLSNNNLLITNKKGQTSLHLAAASGHKDIAAALLFSVTGSSTHHDLLTANDDEGSTVLHTACSNGHIDMFHYLISIYPQGVNVMDNRGRGLLHAACEEGDIGIVKTLIETHGLDPLSEDKDGVSCLHLIKRVYLYQYLEPNITSNPTPKDKSGHTPLHYASRSGNICMVRYFIETFPCTPDDPDNNGYTSVHGACEAGSIELVQYFLINLHCNALAETADRKTLLYYATINSNLELVRFLVVEFGLKPYPHDIDIAKAINPESALANYLQKIFNDMIFDMIKEEKRMKEETHHEKHEQQQIGLETHDIIS